MFVVFDTNVYRTFVNGLSEEESLNKIQELKSLETSKGIKSLLSSTVASELISHILDGDRFDKEGECTKALRIMYCHSGDNTQYGIVPAPEIQLAKEFFNKEDDKGISTEKAIIEIAYQLFLSPSESTVETLHHNIDSIKIHNNEVEEMMSEYLVALANTWRTCGSSELVKSNQVKIIQSLALIISVATKVDFKFPKSDNCYVLLHIFEPFIKLYQERYPIPLQMMVDFCKKCSDSNFIPDKPERVNQVWDQRILHVAGQRIGGQDIILVTNDKGMLDAARNSEATLTIENPDLKKYGIDPASVSNNVMRYSDYISFLEAKI